MTASLARIDERYRRCCEVLGVDDVLRTAPTHDGSAHVELHGGSFAYVVTERGAELARRSTDDADELVYWLARDLTFELAGRYELAHRAPREDSRRALFARQWSLLARLDPAWAERRRGELDDVLASHPFEDA